MVLYLFLGLLLLIFLYILSRKKDTKNNVFKTIPCPPSINWPIFGHVPSLLFLPFKKISKWHKEVGPIYKLNVGNQLWIMIDDPLLAHDVFVTAGSTTSSRSYHYFLSEIHAFGKRGVIFSEYGPIWRENRKKVANILKIASTEKFSHVINFEYTNLVSRLAEKSQEGRAVDPWDHLLLGTMNIILSILISERIDSPEEPEYIAISKISSEAVSLASPAGDIGSFFPLLAGLERFLGLKKKMDRYAAFRNKTLEKLIEKSLQNDASTPVKELFIAKDDELFPIMGDILIAGTESTASEFAWILYLFSQFPEAQQKVIKELDDWTSWNKIGDFPSLDTDRKHFIYTLSALKEILRLYPPSIVGLPHACTADTVVNGYLIPKGAVLIGSLMSMNRHLSFYEDPDVFRPERFMNNSKKISDLANANAEDRDQFAFGLGRRICPGIQLVEREIFSFCFCLFSRFTIEAASDSKPMFRDEHLNYKAFGNVILPTADKYVFVPR